MDSSNPLPSNNESFTDVPSRRALFFTTYYRHQLWSLPDSVIYYITKNPLNPKYYEKIIQSCKYFFIKNPILVVPKVFLNYIKNEWKAMLHILVCDMKNFSSKIWIENRFEILRGSPYKLLSAILPKIYQSEIKYVCISMQKIYYTDFVYLVSKCKEIVLDEVTVIYDENDSVIAMEKIFEVLFAVKNFTYYLNEKASKCITSKTVQKLLQIPHFSNLDNFTLYDIPESFDIEPFYDYMKKNKKTNIQLQFCPQISQQYKNRLQTIVNEIVATKTRDYKIPFIEYSGMGQSTYYQLWWLYRQM